MDTPVANDPRRRGIMLDSEYPYTSKDKECKRDHAITPHAKTYGITDWARAYPNDIDAIKEAV